MRYPVIFFSLEDSALGRFEREAELVLQTARRRTLERGQLALARGVDLAFLRGGWSSGSVIGPTDGSNEPRRERGGKWAKHRPSTIKARELWAKRNGPPAGGVLRLTDSLKEAAGDTSGTAPGSAAFVDEPAGEAGIGVDMSVFPGARALQWGYAPRNLGPRPFLGMTTTTEREIVGIGRDELAQAAERLNQEWGG